MVESLLQAESRLEAREEVPGINYVGKDGELNKESGTGRERSGH